MSRSAGAGSPVFFRCSACRSTLVHDCISAVRLTGRTRAFKHKRGSCMGSRSTWIAREYECSCGHVGWSSHIDLALMAGLTHAEAREARA